MSTRCLIAVINTDGTGQYIYCTSDGYPEWNGRLLLTYYPTKEKALEIMELGDLSALGRSLASESEVNRLEKADRPDYEMAIRADRTSAKHRDRGECWKDSAPRHLSEGLLELDRMIKEPYRTDAEYCYAFVGNCWMVYIRDYHVWKVLSSVPMRSDYPNALLYPSAIRDQPIEMLAREYDKLLKIPNLKTKAVRENIVAEIRRRKLNPHEVFSNAGGAECVSK